MSNQKNLAYTPEKRTSIDWSKHEIIIQDHPEADQIVHYFKRPDTIMQSVKFINTHGILAVTGDYGNWIFCRSFVPSAESDFVSDGYWKEKIRTVSTQSTKEWDAEKMREALNEKIEELEDIYGDQQDKIDKAREYYSECLEYVDDEHEYIEFARYHPVFMDYEDLVLVYATPFWLLAIFDAYDEIVRRLRAEKEETL